MDCKLDGCQDGKWFEYINKKRAETFKDYGVVIPALGYSRTLAAQAKIYAVGISKHRIFPANDAVYHIDSSGGNIGDAVAAMMKSIENYRYTVNECAAGSECRSGTGLYWSGSTSIGCALYRNKGGESVTVCLLNPSGNISGERPY